MYEGKSSWKGKVENRQFLVFRVVQRHLKVRQKVGGPVNIAGPPTPESGEAMAPPAPPVPTPMEQNFQMCTKTLVCFCKLWKKIMQYQTSSSVL